MKKDRNITITGCAGLDKLLRLPAFAVGKHSGAPLGEKTGSGSTSSMLRFHRVSAWVPGRGWTAYSILITAGKKGKKAF